MDLNGSEPIELCTTHNHAWLKGISILLQGDGNEGFFIEMDDLLQAEGGAANEQLAELVQDSVACVCDVKQSGNDCYYRLNDQKVQFLHRSRVSAAAAREKLACRSCEKVALAYVKCMFRCWHGCAAR